MNNTSPSPELPNLSMDSFRGGSRGKLTAAFAGTMMLMGFSGANMERAGAEEPHIVSAGSTCGTNPDTGNINAIAIAQVFNVFSDESVTVRLTVPYQKEDYVGVVPGGSAAQHDGHSGQLSIPAGEIHYKLERHDGSAPEEGTRPIDAVTCDENGGGAIVGGGGGGNTQPPSPPPAESPNACPPAPFRDRNSISTVHRGNVDCAAQERIVAGFADGTYRPAANVRRDQMASYIYRALEASGVELPQSNSASFNDVMAGSAHAEAIDRLVAAGIVKGKSANIYAPGEPVRRDQMASFLVRAAEYATNGQLGSSAPRFNDVNFTNTHFRNVNGAAENGFASGYPDGTFRPGANVRRDQVASFAMRLLGALR